MFEFSFILPPLRKREIGKSLAKAFGSYSAQAVHGGWVDYDGELIEEPMIRYTVAAAESDEGEVYDLARVWAELTEQDVLYFVGVDGVEITIIREAVS